MYFQVYLSQMLHAFPCGMIVVESVVKPQLSELDFVGLQCLVK